MEKDLVKIIGTSIVIVSIIYSGGKWIGHIEQRVDELEGIHQEKSAIDIFQDKKITEIQQSLKSKQTISESDRKLNIVKGDLDNDNKRLNILENNQSAIKQDVFFLKDKYHQSVIVDKKDP